MQSNPRRYPTETEMQTILDKRKQGIPKTRISEEMGISPLIVSRWLDEYDGIIKPKGYVKYSKAEQRKHGGIYFDVSTIGGAIKDG